MVKLSKLMNLIESPGSKPMMLALTNLLMSRMKESANPFPALNSPLVNSGLVMTSSLLDTSVNDNKALEDLLLASLIALLASKPAAPTIWLVPVAVSPSTMFPL